MSAEDTGEAFFAVEGDPCKLAAVIIQEAGGKTDAFSGGYICVRGIVIRTVKVSDLTRIYRSVLYGFQRGRRPSADHQRAAVQVILTDEVLLRQRVISFCYQIDMTLCSVLIPLQPGQTRRSL